MKAKDLVIVLLLICVVILGVLYFSKCNEDQSKPPSDTMKSCQASPKDSCCVDSTYRLDDIYRGGNGCYDSSESYGKAFGKESIEEIRTLIDDAKKRNRFHQIYGYQIDIEHIDEMYNTIHTFDALNVKDKKSGKILKVKGIRLYEAVSTRMIHGKKRRKADLVMIPYLSSGYDVFQVDSLPHPLDNEFKMYAHFRPCPRLCSNKKIYIHQE